MGWDVGWMMDGGWWMVDGDGMGWDVGWHHIHLTLSHTDSSKI